MILRMITYLESIVAILDICKSPEFPKVAAPATKLGKTPIDP